MKKLSILLMLFSGISISAIAQKSVNSHPKPDVNKILVQNNIHTTTVTKASDLLTSNESYDGHIQAYREHINAQNDARIEQLTSQRKIRTTTIGARTYRVLDQNNNNIISGNKKITDK